MKKSYYSLLFVGLTVLTSCGNKAVDVTTYDMRREFGSIKLKNVKKTNEAQVKIDKVIKKYNEQFSYKANYAQFGISTDGKKQSYVKCLNGEITYSSTSFIYTITQTHSLSGSTELQTPITTTYYSNGLDLYSRDGTKAWVKMASGGVGIQKQVARPSIYSYSTAGANIRGGDVKKLYLFEQVPYESKQTTRIISEEGKLKYYYEHNTLNSYFTSYEFIYSSEGEFVIDIPTGLPSTN